MKLTKVIIIVESLQTLKKAFDTVDRHILLKKLEYYSFDVIPNRLLRISVVTESTLVHYMVTSQILLMPIVGYLKIPY